jgi:drug/metabolite transporter (DMT)-like permease
MKPSRAGLVLAYATVYLVWGSSYLFMKFAVESLPPFPMAGARYFLAGAILCGVASLGWRARASPAQWWAATVAGTALMGSNALVAFSVKRIPSGVAALLVAVTPCWMVLFDWLRDREQKPSRGMISGLAFGLVGIVILVGPTEVLGSHIDLLGAGAALVGTVAWALGSLFSRQAARPASPQMQSGMQMLSGGAVLLVATLVLHDWSSFSFAAVSAKSWFAFAYLALVASLAGYTAYIYLLTHATPARAATYAYVNPVVAVALGAVFADEPLSPRLGVAAAVIVGAVAMIVWSGTRSAH